MSEELEDFVPRQRASWSDLPPATQVDPWEQWEHEPDLWYSRFYEYLRLGPKRTLAETYRRCRDIEVYEDGEPVLLGQRPGQAWSRMAREWNWQIRAQQFDLSNADDWKAAYADYLGLIRNESIELSLSLRRQVDEILDKVVGEIDEMLNREDDELTLVQAMKMLGPLTQLRVEMEKSMRLWMGEATEIADERRAVKLSEDISKMLQKVYSDD